MISLHTRNFGQFLHERGLIDGGQLLDVLEQQRAASTTLGEVALDTGVLDDTDLSAIRSEQLRRNADFGSAAVALGLLREEQVVQLQDQLGGKQLLMTRLLVDSGYMSPRDVARAELEYHEESMIRTLQLNVTLEQSSCPRIAEVSASVLQRLFARVMGSPLEMRIIGTAWPEFGGARVWSQDVHVGGQSFTLAIQMTDEHAARIAAIVLDLGVKLTDDLVQDAVSEFLDILTGHISANLDADGGVTAEPPRVTSITRAASRSADAVVLECDGGDIVFHFALP